MSAAEPDPVSTDGLVEINVPQPFLTGPVQVYRNLRRHRYLVTNFIMRDLRLKYRNSVLGYFWSLLEPTLLAVIYFFLFYVLTSRPQHHLLWVLMGVITWTFFARSLNGAVTSLTKNAGMIKQVYFPREIFAVTTVGSNFTVACLNLLVAIPFMVYFGLFPTLYLLMVPLGLVLAALLALGVGLAMASLNAVNRDVEHFFHFVTRAGFFLSPVLWTLDMIPNSRRAILDYLMLNPMVIPITMVRKGIDGEPLGIAPFYTLYSVLFCLLSFLVGAMLFKRYEAGVVKKV